MISAREVRNRLQAFFRKGPLDRQLEEEISTHLEFAVEENVARGMTRDEARRRALIQFGGVQQARERQREARGLPRLDVFLQDLRYTFRTLRRSPGFALIAMLTLALGIGVNTAIFSVVNGMLFSSLHMQDEGRLRVLAFRQKGTRWQPNFSLPEYHDLRDQTKNVFSQVIARQDGMDGLSSQGSKPDRIVTEYVGGNYFSGLGVRPVLGRVFSSSEGEIPGADSVMVLSYRYWKQHFGGDPHIIGRHASLNGHPVTIIGITPKDFHGFQPVLDMQAYLPLGMVVSLENTPLDVWNKRDSRGLVLYARLQAGATPQQAQAALAVVANRFVTANPAVEKDAALSLFPLSVVRNGFQPQNPVNTVSAIFLGLSGLVLLLACVNVTNLLLVRATVREREMVIRSALGAQRSRLMRQMLTESVVLALFGGAGGVGLGVWGSSLLGSVDLHIDLPVYFNFSFDWHVFAFSAALALVAGGIVGIVPALRLSHANLNLVLHEGGRGVTSGGNKFRDALVILQVASALMLLIVAGLFTRSLTQAEHVDLGFNPSHVLTLAMDPSEIGYKGSQSRDFYRSLLERVRALPGVTSATTAALVPMSEVDGPAAETLSINGYQPPQGESAPSVGYNVIGTQYFRTLQIPVLRGRSFAEADNEKGAYVAIVSEAMARKFWPNQDPIGKTFTMTSDATHPLHVVGIAKDARYEEITGAIAPYFYVPFLQHYTANTPESLELRTSGDPAAMIPEVERTIGNMAPNLPIFEVQTLRQALYSLGGLLIYQIAAAMAGVMGTLGLILSIIGVYGVLSYVVSRRTSEIGIRMALGAKRADILRMVYRQGLWIVGIGLVFGLAATLAIAHLLRSLIIVSATDPVTYVGVSAMLTAIALLACYVPARRAMHVEPMKALRAE